MHDTVYKPILLVAATAPQWQSRWLPTDADPRETQWDCNLEKHPTYITDTNTLTYFT